MKYRIDHVTRYAYREPVTLCQNRLCLQPRDTAWQTVISSEIGIEPAPAMVHPYRDRFGNRLHGFCLSASHQSMVLRASSLVDIQNPSWPDPADVLEIEAARGIAPDFLKDTEIAPFLFSSPLIPRLEELADYAAPSFAGNASSLSGVLDLLARMGRDFVYDARATQVTTLVRDAFVARRGVCQDFAHILCGALRMMGLPARYVSGYLETRPPPGKPKLQGVDASHAWVSVYCPPFGWIDADPTNRQLATDSYITIGWGRDYADVSPVAGVVTGGGAHSLSVSVDVLPELEPDAVAKKCP